MAGVIALSLFVSVLIPFSPVAAPKTFGLKFDVKRDQPESPTVTKRAQSVGGALSNEKVRYLMNITVGTPPQYLEIKLDTGSSDMWIPSANSRMCQEFPEECLEHGSCRSSTCLQIQHIVSQPDHAIQIMLACRGPTRASSMNLPLDMATAPVLWVISPPILSVSLGFLWTMYRWAWPLMASRRLIRGKQGVCWVSDSRVVRVGQIVTQTWCLNSSSTVISTHEPTASGSMITVSHMGSVNEVPFI